MPKHLVITEWKSKAKQEKRQQNIQLQIYGIRPLAETWTEVWGGRSRRVSAEIFFCRPPKCDIWGGRRGTHCVREFRYL